MHIRLRGALLLAGCFLLYAMLFTSALLHGFDGSGLATTLLGLVLICASGAVALIGSLELLTGIAFVHLSQRWSTLRGGRRALFSLLLVGISLGLLLAGVLLFRWLNV
jgi:hypothetical protein